jgi:hypothetical protein
LEAKSFLSELHKIDRWTRDIHCPALIHLRILSGSLNAHILIHLDLLTTQTKRVIRDPYDSLWAGRGRVCKPIILRPIWQAREECIVVLTLRHMICARL